MAIDFLDIQSWYEYGREKGWVSEVFCDTHEGPPLSDEEMEEWEDGGDPCSFHIKLWDI
jgi:hypothetical protein